METSPSQSKITNFFKKPFVKLYKSGKKYGKSGLKLITNKESRTRIVENALKKRIPKTTEKVRNLGKSHAEIDHRLTELEEQTNQKITELGEQIHSLKRRVRNYLMAIATLILILIIIGSMKLFV